jgi:aryl-alcohol dehydrogenase-like predicted oxidoreductase
MATSDHVLDERSNMHDTALRTAQLGSTGLQITRVGLGAWAIGGGDWEFGWGAQEDDRSLAAIERALERGINWIDRAAAHGSGHSEQAVGRALEGLAERPYVFTKASLLERPGRRVIHSFGSPEQVDPLVAAADLELDAEDIDNIEGGREPCRQ